MVPDTLILASIDKKLKRIGGLLTQILVYINPEASNKFITKVLQRAGLSAEEIDQVLGVND